jgi:hypothetical protein
MATANDERPTVLVTIDENANVVFHIAGFNPMQLWGIAKVIERHANEIDENAKLMAMSRKPKLVVPS